MDDPHPTVTPTIRAMRTRNFKGSCSNWPNRLIRAVVALDGAHSRLPMRTTETVSEWDRPLTPTFTADEPVITSFHLCCPSYFDHQSEAI